ncbi:glycosyltransferase family 4 protein [Roseomonas populi]|uniref:Glycosyltransferase family 4 protein n=1 Tax=Roseomonas populi TaxID=3121582 RepID=A0ABT1XAI7_9PROT|nr:glycosyltransferase family 4 protein [Roseomonas pecuniae]MCR0985109.1 glycosyltransferase family 4 protein [Roseomonas pecuniae]
MSAARDILAHPGAAPRRAEDPVRLLTFSTLYPSPGRPNHGVFVENRLLHLVGGGEAESTVLAPVPWFPFRGGSSPAEALRHGLRVHHPRFLAPPGLGMLTAPISLYLTARAALARLRERGFDFDLLDAHYLYPDGVAAVWLGQELGKPVVITARGSDVSQLPDYRLPRQAIRRAIAGADALIAVSSGLRDGLLALGAPAEKVTVLRNGVDLDLFTPPVSRRAARAALGLGEEPVLISVGHLIERKGHHHVIGALPMLPGHSLLILGEGSERGALLALARRLGVEERVRFVGAQPHASLPGWYGAADAMVLASSREGWANVLLESMACGTPVVASPAWGSREAVRSPAAGLVLDETTPEAVAAGVRRLLAAPPDRAATRAYAEGFGWEETTAGQMQVFRRVLAARAGA